MMNTAPTGVAIVATQLPRTDRRSLSQAWYSALHVTERETPRPSHASAQPGVTSAPSANNERSSMGKPNAGRLERPPVAAAESKSPVAVLERRVPKTDLARRIERAVLRRGPVAVRVQSSISIKAADGRVQLLVRGSGATTRIIALCVPSLRDRVERALAQARFALAASGTRIEVAS